MHEDGYYCKSSNGFMGKNCDVGKYNTGAIFSGCGALKYYRKLVSRLPTSSGCM